jgi:hypothetical protein
VATRAELRADLQTLAGLDLEDDEANRLLNEGNTELCVRSGWTRANVELGPSVIDQAAYALPEEVYRPLKVKVNAFPYKPVDEETVDRLGTAELYLRTWGVWWLSFDAAKVESVSIFPAPIADGIPIVTTAIVYPDEMAADSDSPAAPKDFHRGVRDYAASVAYGLDEDNPDLQAFHEDAFERQVERLRQHRNSRVGRGDVRMRVEGITA